MACNNCENEFKDARSVVVSFTKMGPNALLYVHNQAKNVVLIRRILLCYWDGVGAGVMYLRASPDAIPWIYPSTYLEPGLTALFYRFNNLAAGTIVQAQAEYIEIDGRSLSCAETM
jgi:hypothetical protein